MVHLGSEDIGNVRRDLRNQVSFLVEIETNLSMYVEKRNKIRYSIYVGEYIKGT